MIALVAFIPAAVLAILLWRSDKRYDGLQKLLTATLDEWTEDRKATLERHEESKTALVTIHEAERKEWTKERGQLLNRIQRPDQAVYENFEPSSLHQHASYGDDADTFAAITESRGDS